MAIRQIPSIRFAVTLDAEDLAHQLDTTEALDLILAIDAGRGDWDFTLALCDHFDKLRAEHAAEEEADLKKVPHEPCRICGKPRAMCGHFLGHGAL